MADQVFKFWQEIVSKFHSLGQLEEKLVVLGLFVETRFFCLIQSVKRLQTIIGKCPAVRSFCLCGSVHFISVKIGMVR